MTEAYRTFQNICIISYRRNNHISCEKLKVCVAADDALTNCEASMLQKCRIIIWCCYCSSSSSIVVDVHLQQPYILTTPEGNRFSTGGSSFQRECTYLQMEQTYVYVFLSWKSSSCDLCNSQENSVKIDPARRKVCEIFAIPRKLFENQPNFKTPRKSTKCPRERERERGRGTGEGGFMKCSKTKIL